MDLVEQGIQCTHKQTVDKNKVRLQSTFTVMERTLVEWAVLQCDLGHIGERIDHLPTQDTQREGSYDL